jgi:hypothetical protein
MATDEPAKPLYVRLTPQLRERIERFCDEHELTYQEFGEHAARHYLTCPRAGMEPLSDRHG